MGCNLRGLVTPKPIVLNELAGKRIGIDAFLVLHQFLATIRNLGPEGDGGPLRDHEGRPVSHLMGILTRSSTLVEAGLVPVFIFDGPPHYLKEPELKKRRESREEAKKDWKEALDGGDFQRAQRLAQKAIHLTSEMVNESKHLLDMLGIPWIESAQDGEGQAAVMTADGRIDAVGSQDWDVLLYGGSLMVRNLLSAGTKRSGRLIQAETIELAEMLEENGINQQQLVDLGIMIGTDFHPGIRGIGPKTGLKLIKEHGTMEGVAKVKGFEMPDNIEEIRDIFLNHPTSETGPLKQSPIHENKLHDFLVGERGFSESRFTTNLDRMRIRVVAKGQTSLDDW